MFKMEAFITDRTMKIKDKNNDYYDNDNFYMLK